LSRILTAAVMGVCAMLAVAALNGCSSKQSPVVPSTATPTEYTGTVEAVSAVDRALYLTQGRPPDVQAHLLPGSTITGIADLAALEDHLQNADRVTVRVRFEGDYHGNPDASSLEVLEVGAPIAWHWHAPLTVSLQWHQWVLLYVPKELFWVTPWTRFTPDSDYRTIDDLSHLAADNCADVDADAVVKDGLVYWARSLTIRTGSSSDCQPPIGSPIPTAQETAH
jgi:hypothetical protein